jgi:ABC-type phosphate/phosphonate transport system substrate-binding protein
LHREFLSLDKHPRGRRILEDAGMLRFVRISDQEYDPIREMELVAATVEWQ